VVRFYFKALETLIITHMLRLLFIFFDTDRFFSLVTIGKLWRARYCYSRPMPISVYSSVRYSWYCVKNGSTDHQEISAAW